jgi:DNA-binding CsgD family transcriptional regulator
MRSIGFSNHYDRIVRLIYQDAVAEQPWMKFAENLATVLNSRDVSLHMFSRSSCRRYFLATSDRAPHLTQHYLDNAIREDLLTELPAPRPMTIGDYGMASSFFRSPYFRKYLAPFEITHILSQDIYGEGDTVVRLSVDRARQQGDFGEEEKSFLQSITPHLRQALRIRNRVQESDGLADQFQHLLTKANVGCIVINARQKILRINDAAKKFTQGNYGADTKGGCLQLGNGIRLRKLRAAIDDAIKAHIHNLTAQQGVAANIQSIRGDTRLDITVKPLFLSDNADPEAAPAAILLVNDRDSGGGDIDTHSLTAAYKLTRCEARLGALLAKGYTLKEAAEELQVSINTVKTHQQGIYAKLGKNRRSQVVNILTHCTAKLL